MNIQYPNVRNKPTTALSIAQIRDIHRRLPPLYRDLFPLAALERMPSVMQMATDGEIVFKGLGPSLDAWVGECHEIDPRLGETARRAFHRFMAMGDVRLALTLLANVLHTLKIRHQYETNHNRITYWMNWLAKTGDVLWTPIDSAQKFEKGVEKLKTFVVHIVEIALGIDHDAHSRTSASGSLKQRLEALWHKLEDIPKHLDAVIIRGTRAQKRIEDLANKMASTMSSTKKRDMTVSVIIKDDPNSPIKKAKSKRRLLVSVDGSTFKSLRSIQARILYALGSSKGPIRARVSYVKYDSDALFEQFPILEDYIKIDQKGRRRIEGGRDNKEWMDAPILKGRVKCYSKLRNEQWFRRI